MQKEKVRFFALARELSVETKFLLTLCRENGIDVMNQLSTIEPEVRDAIVQLVRRRGSSPASAAPAPTAPPPPMGQISNQVRVLGGGLLQGRQPMAQAAVAPAPPSLPRPKEDNEPAVVNPYIGEAIRKFIHKSVPPRPSVAVPCEPGQQRPGADRKPSASVPSSGRVGEDLQRHVGSVGELVEALVAMSLSYRDGGFDSLAADIRRLVYTLVTHLGKLAKRPGGSVGPGTLRQVGIALDRMGIPDWSADDRVAWCHQCKHDPLYSRWERECETCGWLICPRCNKCKAGCKRKEEVAVSASAAPAAVAPADDGGDIPF